MPIKDLSNRQRVPRLDKIRLGIKVKGSKSEYPKAVDYFVCPPEVKAIYGDQPKELKIAFHSNDIEEIFPQYYKRYGSGTGLVCKGDGETAMCLFEGHKVMEEITCPGRECEFYKANKCSQVANLIFMVRGVARFGVYQLDTGSYNSILNINGGLEFVKGITKGQIKMVPLILAVIPQEVNPDGKKKTIHVLRIEADIKEILLAKKMDSPGEILIIEDPRNPDIEEDIHPTTIVETIKPTTENLADMWSLVKDLGKAPETWWQEISERYTVTKSEQLSKVQFDEIMTNLDKEKNLVIDAEIEPTGEIVKQGTLIK